MGMPEKVNISGLLTICLRDANTGQMFEQVSHKNLITLAGREMLAEMFSGTLKGTPKITIAVGDGTDDASIEDTKLGNKLDEADTKPAKTRIFEEEGVKKSVATVTATLPKLPGEGEQAISEAGMIFYIGSNDPILYNRVVFPVITRRSNLEMDMTWEVSF